MACNSGTEISDEYVQGDPGTEISDEYVEKDSGSGTSYEYVDAADLLQISVRRFSQEIRYVTIVADMMEERFKSEDMMVHLLQNYSYEWAKEMADAASSGNADFQHGSIYAAITNHLMEPIDDAKIYNLVKKEGLGNDGPVTFLRSLKAEMERSHIPKDAFKLYSTAWKKQTYAEIEIEKAMEYYHLRKYKLENGKRQLQANPSVLSSRAEARLRKSIFRYHYKCEDAQEEYKKLLTMEEAGRGQRMADIRTPQLKFETLEKKHMMNTAAGIGKFIDVVEKLDTERANHQRLLQDIHALLDKMDVETDVRNLVAQNINRREFPVFVEFDEKTANQKNEKKNWLKKLYLGIRKRKQIGGGPEVIINRRRNKQCEGPKVIIADESDPNQVTEKTISGDPNLVTEITISGDPNLVTERTISGDDSGDIKEITTPDNIVDYNEDEESETEIFEIDEKGREIKMKPKQQTKASDVRALGNHEELSNGACIMVKAGPTTEHFELPHTLKSDCEPEICGISKMNCTIDLGVDTDTSPVPPELTRKAKKLEKKTRKESTESIKPIKESTKVKDKGQTEVNVEKRKVEDKVQEKVTVESSDSDTDTHVPDAAEVRTLANVKVIAIEDYIAQNRHELTLKAGKKIKQKIPANSDGMAYGWIRKGKLRRKIYGYYPANLVELKPKKEKGGIRGLLSKKRGVLKVAS